MVEAQAIVVEEYGDESVLTVHTKEITNPKNTQVLVKIMAAGINPVDTYHRSGGQGYGPKLPFVPGLDGSGIIEEIGDSVSKFKNGDRVYFCALRLVGSYQQYVVLEEDEVSPLSDELNFAEGAALFVNYATAYQALVLNSQAQKDQCCFIHGASGGVGVAAIQWGKSLGLTIIASAGTNEGMKFIRDQGVDLAVNHKDPRHYSEILDFTESKGVDIIIEMAAHINLTKDCSIVKPRGKIVIIGSRGELAFSPRLLMSKDLSVTGQSLFNLSDGERLQCVEALNKAVSEKKLKPIIQQTYPLEQTRQAHKDVMLRPKMGKLILLPH
jgi:NADPH2:quinone reductase